MKALSYEYLIRAVFSCGRTYKHGADADIFRSLEHSLTGDELKKGINIGIVMTYLKEALNEVKSQNKDNKEFCDKVEKCKDNLHLCPTYEDICKCIDEAWIAFKEIGLIVRD